MSTTTTARPATLIVSAETARAAAAAARRTRASWLVDIAEGNTTPLAAVVAATSLEGRPLRRIRLAELLANQPGWGSIRVRKTLEGVLHQLDLRGQRPDTAKLTVGWLIDTRSNGSRFTALLHALSDRVSPWPGFPFEPQLTQTTVTPGRATADFSVDDEEWA